MHKLGVLLYIASALCHAVAASPYEASVLEQRPLVDTSSSSSSTHAAKRRKLHGKFLHITDFHPDDFYKAGTSTDEHLACHRGHGPAGVYGAELSDCDSPFTLVNATIDWIGKNLKDEVDFVVWTGDSARHDSDEKNPRTTAEVLRTNKALTDQLVATLSSTKGRLDIPIIPTLGNNDFLPHNIFFPGPNKWLDYYSKIWENLIPEEQQHSFKFGGWFYVEVIPNRLAVFSLNTMYFFDRNAGVDGCASPSEPGFEHMEWLRVQLTRMRELGMKVILMGHVPPARTDNKSNWEESCWQKYTLWLNQFRDIVVGSIYGHMNIDHFLLADTKEIDIDSAATPGKNWKRGTLSESDEEVSLQSKSDYLIDLRAQWSSLPSEALRALEEDEDAAQVDEASEPDPDVSTDTAQKGNKSKKKKKKKSKKKRLKKIGGKYAERYQLSLISPSVVPNYLPTIRVIEYNLTGLEQATTWFDVSQKVDSFEALRDAVDPHALVDVDTLEKSKGKKQKKHKGKKHKGKKGKKTPSDPNLIIPDDPDKSALPGPAYSLQPLSFTGYTQYVANLTHINNVSQDSGGDKKKKKPAPRNFEFQVEYSTFDDSVYKLPDLTVKNFVKLAYRIGKRPKGGKTSAAAVDDDDKVVEWEDDANEGEMVSDQQDESDAEIEQDDEKVKDAAEPETSSKGKKHKKKKKKKKIKNEVWLHFLSRAFVGTVPVEELEDS